jgi:hypothetical protein
MNGLDLVGPCLPILAPDPWATLLGASGPTVAGSDLSTSFICVEGAWGLWLSAA